MLVFKHTITKVFKTKEKSCIRINIRKLNRVPVTKYLSYIYLANSLCYTNLAYLKVIYILYTVNI